MTDATPELIAEQVENRAKRKAFVKSGEGQMARALSAAMGEYFTARAQGVTQEDACKGLEYVLRDALPQTKYPKVAACITCDDSGWERRACEGDEGSHGPICGRAFLHGAHDFVRPCYCDTGEKIRRQLAPKTSEEDAVAAAARTAKRGGWKRPGQR